MVLSKRLTTNFVQLLIGFTNRENFTNGIMLMEHPAGLEVLEAKPVFWQKQSRCFRSGPRRISHIKAAVGVNLKAIVTFEDSSQPIEIKTGISPVDIDGARKNFMAEADKKSFDQIKNETHTRWSAILGTINIETKDPKKKELFYTALFNMMLYLTLYSDVDNRFRGSDRVIRQTDGYAYYGGVMGFWETFRAACPLQSVLQPKVMEDYVKTCLDFYKYSGQWPI